MSKPSLIRKQSHRCKVCGRTQELISARYHTTTRLRRLSGEKKKRRVAVANVTVYNYSDTCPWERMPDHGSKPRTIRIANYRD